MAYDHRSIEKKAQEKWAGLDLYRADLSDESKAPYYLLVEFPYPSGDLHIGHWYAFAVTDMYARLLRMRGKNVLFPIGFDAFGLPAENAAIKNGVNPKDWTYKNIERMRGQLMSMGASFDWSKEVIACDAEYYKWTQWLFAKLFEHKLAEHREAAVKWCPKDQTVLANEQIVDGKCERCGTEVEEKRLTQWFLKITDYAERLLAGLDSLPWREEIKDAQRAWIGKSEGAKLKFGIKFDAESMDIVSPYIEVFTTRPDTIFGVTYVVLAPEHPLVSALLEGSVPSLKNADEVGAYVKSTAAKTERERSENKEKTGVKLEGVMAINPATKEEIPVYVADYVLASYGTGAVMAVPAHDERDFAFAQKMKLPSKQVIAPYFPTIIGKDAVRPDKPTVRRKTAYALLKHWSEDKYLCLNWEKFGWHSGIIGGIDDGESPEQAGAREIIEETGYQHPEFVRSYGEIHSSFFAGHKDVNRYAEGVNMLFRLRDDAYTPPTKEETENHNTVWVDGSEMRSFLNLPNFNYFWHQIESGDECFTDDGVLVNSGEFTGRESTEAKWDIVAYVGGEKTTNYRIRDWLVSRQRYWGCPIPIVYDPEGKPHAIPAEHLPWLLPTDVDFTPTGEAPLASSQELKERVTRIFGEGWTPEHDTLDTFVDSSWYFLRYLDPKDSNDFSDAALMKKWLPVNRYSGGSEHTTMHLLYARFFMKALYDLALVPVDEPFTERFNRGLIMGPDGQKMSKSKGNVINPDEFVQKYGADAVRIYLAFIGPYNEPGNYPWNLDGVAGMRRFLERVERLTEKCGLGGSTAKSDLAVEPPSEMPASIQQAVARASAKVAEDGDRFKFNTGIAALMVLVNELEATDTAPREAVEALVIMLAPFAPHLAEHLWERLDENGSVHSQSWPEAVLAVASEVSVAVQVNGKRRGEVVLKGDAGEEDALAAARALPTVVSALGNAEPKRVIYVPGKIINIVA